MLDFCSNLVAGQTFEAACERLNDYLSLRTYFGDYDLTIADLGVWGALQGLLLSPFRHPITAIGFMVLKGGFWSVQPPHLTLLFLCAALPIWAKFQKSPNLPHLIRWYEHCCSLPAFAEVVNEFDARKKRHTEMVAKSVQKSGTGSSESLSSILFLYPFALHL